MILKTSAQIFTENLDVLLEILKKLVGCEPDTRFKFRNLESGVISDFCVVAGLSESPIYAHDPGEVPQILFLELQEVIRLTAQAFKDLGAVGSEVSQQKFSELLAAVDVVSQRLENLRQEGNREFSLDAIIAFSSVILQIKEITENLNQMAQGWPSFSLLSSNSTSAV